MGEERVRAYYDADPRREWERLSALHDRVEYAVSLRALEEHLPSAPAAVLDVGGGPGRYAIELARRGYDVTLADLSSANLGLCASASGGGGRFAGGVRGAERAGPLALRRRVVRRGAADGAAVPHPRAAERREAVAGGAAGGAAGRSGVRGIHHALRAAAVLGEGAAVVRAGASRRVRVDDRYGAGAGRAGVHGPVHGASGRRWCRSWRARAR